MKYRLRAHLILPLALALAAGCSRDDAEPAEASEAGEEQAPAAEASADDGDGAADEGEALLAAEMQAYEAARPVFETHCAVCHQPGEPEALEDTLHHFSMEGYPFGGHHAHEMGEIIRAVLGADGSEATMPEGDPEALSDEELALVVTWSEAFDRAHAAGVGHHAELEHHDH